MVLGKEEEEKRRRNPKIYRIRIGLLSLLVLIFTARTVLISWRNISTIIVIGPDHYNYEVTTTTTTTNVYLDLLNKSSINGTGPTKSSSEDGNVKTKEQQRKNKSYDTENDPKENNSVELYESKRSTNTSISSAKSTSTNITIAQQGISSMNKKSTISYVTNFWAQSSAEERHPHRLEIEAAILSNINNPHFDQVVILLDGVSESANCTHFIQYMKQLQQTKNNNASSSATFTTPSHHQSLDQMFSHVNCFNIPGGQPTYFQMFNYSISEKYVQGDIVVLGNADHVFDDTISKAPYMFPPSSSDNETKGFYVLSSKGFTHRIPNKVQTAYNDIMPQEFHMNITKNKKKMKSLFAKMEQPPVIRCRAHTSFSWDTFIFQPKEVRGDDGQKPKIHEQDFKRRKMNDEWKPYMMNEDGAENAALWDLTRNIPNSEVYNACDIINSWHFHLAPKQHKKYDENDEGSLWNTPEETGRKRGKRVPNPSHFSVKSMPESQLTRISRLE